MFMVVVKVRGWATSKIALQESDAPRQCGVRPGVEAVEARAMMRWTDEEITKQRQLRLRRLINVHPQPLPSTPRHGNKPIPTSSVWEGEN